MQFGPSHLYLFGVTETKLGDVWDESECWKRSKAKIGALAEALITLRGVYGLSGNYLGEEGVVQFAENLDIPPRYSDSSGLGDAPFVSLVRHALVAITACRCAGAFIDFALRQSTRRQRSTIHPIDAATLDFQFPSPTAFPFSSGPSV